MSIDHCGFEETETAIKSVHRDSWARKSRFFCIIYVIVQFKAETSNGTTTELLTKQWISGHYHTAFLIFSIN